MLLSEIWGNKDHQTRRRRLKSRVAIIREVKAFSVRCKGRGNAYQGLIDLISLIAVNYGDHDVSGSKEKDGNIAYSVGGHRYHTTISRYARRLLKITPDNLPDHVIADLGHSIKDKISDKKSSFTVLTGKDVAEAYHFAKGYSSCMCGNRKLVSLYALNPDKIKLVLFDEPGIGSGRALLWHPDKGKQMLDRIYPPGGPVEQRINRWGRENGYTDKRDFDEADYHEFVVENVTHNNTWPYGDTVSWGRKLDGEDGTKAELRCRDDGKCSPLSTRDGSWTGGPRCNGCRNVRHDMAIGLDGLHYCGYCFSSRYFICYDCGEVHPKRDKRIVGHDEKKVCPPCYKNRGFVECSFCDKIVNKREMNRVQELGPEVYMCRFCVRCSTIAYLCNKCGALCLAQTGRKGYANGEFRCAPCVKKEEKTREAKADKSRLKRNKTKRENRRRKNGPPSTLLARLAKEEGGEAAKEATVVANLSAIRVPKVGKAMQAADPFDL